MATSSISNPRQLTTSNVYLAFGLLDDQPVMKIGKANDVAKRQKQICIGIELFCPCETEKQAFQLESKLRRMMRGLGASRIANLRDWHVYDADIYEQVKEALTNGFGVKVLQRTPEYVSVPIDPRIIELEREQELFRRELRLQRIRLLTRIAVEETELYFWQRGDLTLEGVVKELPDVA